MKDCIYNTDPNWVNCLRKQNLTDGVNFWRKDRRRVHLTPGAYFYFKLRGRQVVVGRGTLRCVRYLTIDDAWDEYGVRNGVESLSEFHKRLSELYEMNQSFEGLIGCIILDNLIWLNHDERVEITETEFPPTTLASTYHVRGELVKLEGVFKSHVLSADDTQIIRVKDSGAYVPSGPTESIPEELIKILSAIETDEPVTPPDFTEPSDPALRQKVFSYRVVRDTALAAQIKSLYNYRCQLCGNVLESNSNVRYAEAHHIKPLGIPHNGPDSPDNIVCVCPNCHALLDYGFIRIESDTLNQHIYHRIAQEYIQYHNTIIYGKVR